MRFNFRMRPPRTPPDLITGSACRPAVTFFNFVPRDTNIKESHARFFYYYYYYYFLTSAGIMHTRKYAKPLRLMKTQAALCGQRFLLRLN